ncbi:MAG: aminoacyl-tRNA hydrolase [Holosporales bacterium]|jgi:PTH1 family peptidyl-tRNA hydrolase|nr:aminoacyl-tRNA hydrolase [Holosporales bacterium]
MNAPLVVVGLGNPGSAYENHRHNAGSLALRELAKRWRFPSFTNKKSFELSVGHIGEHKVFLLRPLTFMNDSGRAVREFASFYKLSLGAFLIVHDDLDLAPSSVRLKKGGGSGGHNGLKSIDAVLGNGYWRLRIGIGHPGQKDLVIPYVLSAFSKEEREQLAFTFTAIAENFPLFACGELDHFMQQVQKALMHNPEPLCVYTNTKNA